MRCQASGRERIVEAKRVNIQVRWWKPRELRSTPIVGTDLEYIEASQGIFRNASGHDVVEDKRK
jgi:hypothetical protein